MFIFPFSRDSSLLRWLSARRQKQLNRTLAMSLGVCVLCHEIRWSFIRDGFDPRGISVLLFASLGRVGATFVLPFSASQSHQPQCGFGHGSGIADHFTFSLSPIFLDFDPF